MDESDLDLARNFFKPGAAYRGKPFWAWNGKLEREELLRQVGVFKEMGFGGFFMHARTGLVTEYLGQEWFDLTNACADEAQRLGLEAWLYDEDRWPSGIAGGLVTCDVQFRAKVLQLEIVTPEKAAAAPGLADVVAAFIANLDGVVVRNWRRIHWPTGGDREAPALAPGETLLIFRARPQPSDSFHNGYTYLDTLKLAATERFLQVTHEQYVRHCGHRLGGSIKGIFTDEPHRGALLNGFSIPDPQGYLMTPWTEALPQRFLETFGYDLLERLPELFLLPDGQKVSPVKWHYVELLQQMYLDNFVQPCDRWCREHRLVLTGHGLHEDNLTAQTAMTGSLMRCYEHMEYPGIDVLTEGNRNYWIAKQLQSAARQLGRKRLMSELYGCTGWQMPFAAHKAVGDWQALFGINLRCQHLSWFTMQGEAKRDYPASIFHQSAWWKSYQSVETYFARLGVLNAVGRPAGDVLVINPVESVWCRVYAGWSRTLAVQDADIKELEKGYAALFHVLQGAQIDFDYADEEMLGRMGRIVDGPEMKVGQAAYRLVVVGQMTTIRSSTLKLLEEFADAGGAILFLGDPPEYANAVRSAAPKRLAARAARAPFKPMPLDSPEFPPMAGAVVEACDRALGGYQVRVTDEQGQPSPQIFCQLRRAKNVDVLTMINTDRDQLAGPVNVRVRARGVVEHWDCLTAAKRRVPAQINGNYLEFTEHFPPAGEHTYVIQHSAAPDLPLRETLRTVRTFALPGPFAFHLTEENVCVLDRARFKVQGGPWRGPEEILAADRQIRTTLGLPHRAGDMLQPWFVRKFHPEMLSGTKAPLQLEFAFNIDVIPSGALFLAMENPAAFTVQINGTPVDLNAADGWWVDASIIRISLPAGALKMGGNVISLTTEFHHGLDLEAIYVLGNFGVRLDDAAATLTRLPEKLAVGDVCSQALPFYSGGIVYEIPADAVAGMRTEAGERVVLATPGIGGACARLLVADEEKALIPWPPYEAEITEFLGQNMALEIVLTRRNTFGPLHEFPLNKVAVGPGNFTTTGDHFRAAPVLVETGLLRAPEIRIMRE